MDSLGTCELCLIHCVYFPQHEFKAQVAQGKVINTLIPLLHGLYNYVDNTSNDENVIPENESSISVYKGKTSNF